jgi:DNA-binding LacI/PurR family transcriptional regulator
MIGYDDPYIAANAHPALTSMQVDTLKIREPIGLSDKTPLRI